MLMCDDVFFFFLSYQTQACLCCCAGCLVSLVLMVDNIFETKRSAASFIPFGSIRKIGEEVPYLYKSASISESPSVDFMFMAEEEEDAVRDVEDDEGVLLMF